MSDPVVRFHGSNLIEVVDGTTTHYIKKDTIQCVNVSSYRIGIHVVGRSDVLFMSFVDRKLLHSTMGNIIAELSNTSQSELDVVKDMIDGVRKIQQDLKESMTTVTTTLGSFKDDIQREFKSELARSVEELSAADDTLEERVAALEVASESDASDESGANESDANESGANESDANESDANEIVPVIKTNATSELMIFILIVIIILFSSVSFIKGM